MPPLRGLCSFFIASPDLTVWATDLPGLRPWSRIAEIAVSTSLKLIEDCVTKDELMIHPNDADGDALRRLEADGDILTRPRNIDFAVVFADANSAEQFAEHFRALGHTVSVEARETDGGFPWDVIVVQHMVPTYDGIRNFEDLLQSVADNWGGHNDGWGCFAEPSSA